MSATPRLPFTDAFMHDIAELTPVAQVELAMLVWLAIHRQSSFEFMCHRYLVTRAQKNAYMHKVYGWTRSHPELAEADILDEQQDEVQQLQQRIEALQGRCAALQTTIATHSAKAKGVAARMTMEYLRTLPAAVPADRVLVHNAARSRRRLGSRGFRAWLSRPDTARLERCACPWAPALGPHFRVAATGL